MIRLRCLLERGRAHPILGPILLIVLVLVLVMVFLHAAQDGHDAATELGVICLGIAIFFGLVLSERLRSFAPRPLILVRGDRGPPSHQAPHATQPTAAAVLLTLPLRR